MKSRTLKLPKQDKEKITEEITIAEDNEDNVSETSSQDELPSDPTYSSIVSGKVLAPSGLHDSSTIIGKRGNEETFTTESKKARRARLKETSLADAINGCAETEKISSLSEVNDLKLLVAKLASDNNAFREELTSIKNQSSSVKSDINYGFFENVIILESATDVTKSKVMQIISQFRSPIFTKSVLEIIQPRAKRIIDFELMSNGYAVAESDIELLSDTEYINMIEKLFQNAHHDTNTLSRFSKIKLAGLFAAGKISQVLLNSLLEAIEQMTDDDVRDVQLQKSLINRAFSLLSNLEPARIQLTSKVAKCVTFQEFLMVWTRYRNSKQVIADTLAADGYVVSPKVYIMSY